MSTIVLSGDTSGAITIAAPAVAGTNTLTLPALTGTVLTTASTFGGTGPAFSAYLGTIQSVSDSVATKVKIDTKIFDTASAFDNTTNYRFTPQVAGYYQVNATANPNTVTTQITVSVYKNGTQVAASVGTTKSASVSTIVYLNGSTDYIEMYGYLSGVTPQIYGGSNNAYTIFSAAMIRSA